MNGEGTKRNRLMEPVPWGVFMAVVTLLVSVFGVGFGSLQARVLKGDADREAILVQLSQIQTDLRNLDARLVEVRQDIKAIR